MNGKWTWVRTVESEKCQRELDATEEAEELEVDETQSLERLEATFKTTRSRDNLSHVVFRSSTTLNTRM